MIFNSNIWLLHNANHFLPIIHAEIKKIEAGAVDDAQRVGLPIEKNGPTAVIKTVGPMIKYAGYLSHYGIAGTRDTEQAMLSALQDDDIENILWVIDTPGGNTDGLFDLAQTVKRVNAIKPILVQVDGMLASAGYYVAANATKIVAVHDNLIGSIGVRTAVIDSHKYYESLGVKVIPIDTGEHKSAGMDGVEVTDSQVKEIQKIVDGLFETFLTVVEEGRGLDRGHIEGVADGRLFLSSEALNLGLIDEIQPLSETMAELNSKKAQRSTRFARAALAALHI